jgi:hypothetical protein
MPKGNPNPSPKTRIGAPGGPAPGKTSEQKRLELENAQRAMRIRDRFLRSLEAKLNDSDMDAVIEMMDAQALKLLKDSEDRGLGAPVQSHTSPDGSFAPSRIVIEAARDDRDNSASA